MNIRPKTVRRLAILAAGVVLIALCVVSIWIVHQRNKEKQQERLHAPTLTSTPTPVNRHA